MSRDFSKRQIEILEAVVKAEGRAADAADALGCTPANVTLLLRRLGLSAGRGGRQATLTNVSRWLADHSFARGPERTRAAETVTVPARCHPDRQEYQMGLCRDCYRERVDRSRANSIGVVQQEQARPVQRPSSGRMIAQAPTPSQFRVLEALADGRSRQEAADSLGINERTVSSQLSDVYSRLGVDSIVGAYAALGWLRVDYNETMVVEFVDLLKRLDDAVHRAMRDAARAPALTAVGE